MVGKDDEKINQMNDKEMVQKWMKSIYQAAVLFAYFLLSKLSLLPFPIIFNIFSIMIIIFVLTMTNMGR